MYPVSPDLYAAHRGFFTVKPGDIAGRVEDLDAPARETIRAVLDYLVSVDELTAVKGVPAEHHRGPRERDG